MANQSLFASSRPQLTVNLAGGKAYALSAKEALAQYAVCGTLHDTYYADARQHLDKLKELCDAVDAGFIAKTAVYARQSGYMKDIPAYLMADLTARREQEWLERAFPRVINDGRMLRTYVQMVRSGTTGRKSFGTAPRRLIRDWFMSRDHDRILRNSVGSNPTMADVIKMAHVKPDTKEKEALFNWLIKGVSEGLPPLLQQLEDFNAGRTLSPPELPFQYLMAKATTQLQWASIAATTSWQTLRMNLNTFLRHGVFTNPPIVEDIARRLSNREEIEKAKVFPYQLMTAYQNIDPAMPRPIVDALHDAMELATMNVPQLPSTAIAVDVSGSMQDPITGHTRKTSKTKCVDVAALIAVVLTRRAKESVVMPFDTRVYDARVEPRDTIMTSAKILAQFGGGGTNCSLPMAVINHSPISPDLVVYVSDCESWVDRDQLGMSGLQSQWRLYQLRNPNAKLVLIDLTPNATSQIPTQRNVLRIGGFSDDVFNLIRDFVAGETTALVDTIEHVVL
jgi:60 kDa SS-A/Ro ribonucleoprotein